MRISVRSPRSGIGTAAAVVASVIVVSLAAVSITYLVVSPANTGSRATGTQTITATITETTTNTVTETTTLTTSGPSASTAQVSVTSITLPAASLPASGATGCRTSTAGSTACMVVLSNSGNADTYATGTASITFGGSTYQLSVSSSSAACSTSTSTCPVNTGIPNTLYFYAFAGSIAPASGEQFVGSISLGDGEPVQFSGTFT